MGVARNFLLRFFRGVSAIYFRETEVVGAVPSHDTKGRIFAANHVNGLVDPILVLTNAPCPASPVAKSTLWKVPVLKWLLDAVDAVPVVRRRDDPNKPAEANDEIFERVASHLSGGGNILIFPEGTSHNEPHLVKLKSGAARMLARAHAAGARGLSFQAVGLEFEARDTFRSRALVVYGPVRAVDDLGVAGDDLAKAITDRLREDLSELLVEGADWEERELIARVASLFAHDTGDRSLEAWNAIGRQVEAARKALGPEHGAMYAQIKEAVSRYFDALDASDLRDADVATGDTAAMKRGAHHGKRRKLYLALSLPLAIPGALLYWVPYQIPRLVSRRAAKQDHDVVSTYKLATGLVVFPVWAGALVGASFALLPPPVSVAAAAVAVASPFAALYWLDHLEQRKIGRRRAAPSDIARIGAMRAELVALLARAREAVAPAATAAS